MNHQQSELDARYASLRRRAIVLNWVCGGSALVAFTGNFLPDEWIGIPLVGLLVCLATAWPAYRLHARSSVETRRRETAPMAPDRIVSLEQSPVLYLRSFEDDQRAARLKGQLTEEEHLASVLSQIGPFVAVGRPGEALPTVGASRVYLGDDQWQPTVESLLRGSRLVIIRTGRTAQAVMPHNHRHVLADYHLADAKRHESLAHAFAQLSTPRPGQSDFSGN